MKKINESLENRNKVVKKSSAKSVKSFSINRLYNKIKDSLDKNTINENILKKYNKSEEKIDLHFKVIKSNRKNKNNIINNTKNLLTLSNDKNIYYNTLLNFTNSNITNKIPKLNTIDNNLPNHNKIKVINKKNYEPIKAIHAKNSYNMKKSSYNNINDKKIFLNEYYSNFIKINIHNFIGFSRNNNLIKQLTPDNYVNNLNLKNNILYKPMFPRK